MTKYKIIGVIGLLSAIILLSFYSTIILNLSNFIEQYVSHDKHIEPEAIDNFKKLLSTIIMVLAAVSILFVFNGFKKLADLAEVFINIKKVKKTLLTNDLTTKENLQKRLFLIGTSFALFLPYFLPIINQPKSEGFIEEGSSTLFFISALILIASIVHIHKMQLTPSIRKKIKLFLITLSVLLIIMFGEEISWGQRIFDWEAEGVFKEYNVQSETNIHNFFNSLFVLIYPLFGFCMFIFLFFLWFFPKENRPYITRLLIPHPSMFFLVFIMACLTYNGHSEIFEELLALFCVLYSIRIYYCLKFPKVVL